MFGLDKMIRKSIHGNKQLTSCDINVSVNDDKVVFLSGEVDNWAQVVAAGHIAGKKRGVKGVVNDITVKGKNILRKNKTSLIQKGKRIGMVDEKDVIIIGGGIIGCGIARELSKYNLKVNLIEKEADVSEGASKANNGMIHPGNAVKPGTLKAKLNVRGNAMYPNWAKELGFDFKRTGSLIIAYSKKERLLLKLIYGVGKINGVPDMKNLSGDKVMEMEPTICKKPLMGLYSPTTAYVDGYEVTAALAENAAMNGVDFYLNTQVVDVLTEDGKVKGVITDRGIFKGKYVINCAGIYADEISEMAGDRFFTLHPRRGCLIIFDKSKLGVNRSTGVINVSNRNKQSKGGGPQQTIAGNALWGPSATEIPNKDDKSVTKEEFEYSFNTGFKVNPNLSKSDVITYFSGIRASSYNEDFIIGMSDKVEGFINVAAIQSPGLASAPAIAEMVENIILEHGKIKKNPNFNPIRKPPIKFRDLSFEEQDALIKENPMYGHVVCRCETITEAEIVNAIHGPIPATTVDAVKRRTRSGMGRCQGGFCGPKILNILSRELGVDITKITLKGDESYIIDSKSR